MLHVGTLSQPIRSDLAYGPIETVIHNIDQGLHSLGHRSIVACSGDSRVAGEHFVTVDRCSGPYWSDDTPVRRASMNTHLSKVVDRAMLGDIDVIHAHDAKTVNFVCDSLSDRRIPVVMTLHVPPQEKLLEKTYQRWFGPLSSYSVHCAAISEYQKKQYHDLVDAENVVYHGIDVNNYPFKEKWDKNNYLFNIGRITRDKGQDKAIEVAQETGSKLIIAGCVQNKAADMQFFAGLRDRIDLFVDVEKYAVDNDYHDKVIKPLLDSDKQIIYIGEISSAHKKQWFQHARATLFSIQWGEPFGLVMIESMACGTPVIAFNRGAVPEIMVDGKTGFVVDSVTAMIEAVARIDSIDPRECRQHMENHFSVISMANKYLKLYKQIIVGKRALRESCDSLTHSCLPEPLHGGVIAAQ